MLGILVNFLLYLVFLLMTARKGWSVKVKNTVPKSNYPIVNTYNKRVTTITKTFAHCLRKIFLPLSLQQLYWRPALALEIFPENIADSYRSLTTAIAGCENSLCMLFMFAPTHELNIFSIRHLVCCTLWVLNNPRITLISDFVPCEVTWHPGQTIRFMLLMDSLLR